MMRRRELMKSNKTNVLPIGYEPIIGTNKLKQVTIVSFPFTVMIDTTIVSLEPKTAHPYSCIFGVNSQLQLAYDTSGIPTVGNASASKQFVHENHRHVFEGKFTDVASDSYYKINGEDTGLHRKTDITSNFFLLSASTFYQANALIHNLKIFDNDGVLIHDYLPCVRTSDSTEGLYDIVNNQFI